MRSLSVDRAVSMMIGTFAVSGRARRMRHTSTPLSTGRFRSRTIRSGRSSLTAFSAVSPLTAVSTSMAPSRSSACLMSPAISCSSSTTRTRVRPAFMAFPSAHRSEPAFPRGDEGVKCGLHVESSKLQVPSSNISSSKSAFGQLGVWFLELRIWNLPGEDAADFDDERVGGTRLRHEPVAAGACCALQITGSVVRGERHDRNMCRALICLEAARRLPPIKHAQAQVHTDDVARMRGGMGERILPVACFDYVEARQLQLLRIQTPQIGLILDEQNQGLGAHRN